MSKTVAPLLSFDARGQIAKTQVYSSWKGRSYVRRYVVPSNPNSVDQQETRNTFKWLQNVFKYMPAGALDAWDAYATNSRFTAANGFIKVNLANLIGEADLTNFVFSPAANGGLAATGISVAAGAAQLTVTITAPALPTGWTITKGIAAAIRQQDPQTGVLYSVFSAEDATTPYAPVITGLTASQVYRVGGWFEYAKADLTAAFGQAVMGVGTPT